MLEATFLGHQGWRFTTSDAAILVDPLLVEAFGHQGLVGQVYPPRVIDIPAMGPIDAVVLTHEHEDHFNIPSLNRIARDVPVFVPERSSSALRGFLKEMGFPVHALVAGQSIELADMQFTPFSADHVRQDEQDEWDTTPFLVLDRINGGSFFSPVDVSMSASLEAQLERLGVAPGLFGYANNVSNLSFQEMPPRPALSLTTIAARFVADHSRRARPRLASLMVGGGFAFSGSRAWMNHAFFPIESQALFAALTQLGSEETFFVPAPGWQIVVDAQRIRGTTDQAPFLSTAPKDRWPDRTFRPGHVPADRVEPAGGRESLQAGELESLGQRLNEFAQFLYGGPLFRALYSLAPGPSAARTKTRFAINAVSGEAEHLFEYLPEAGRFAAPEKSTPLSEYAAGLECYATDLLEFLEGKLPPSALMFGRLCRWRGSAENTTAAIDKAIWTFGHPLRRQTEYLSLYRKLLASEPASVPRIARRITLRA